MRRALLLAPCLLLLGSVLAAPSSGAGQGTPRAARTPLAGTWAYAGDRAEGDGIVQQAIEPVVSRMRADLQPVARERIAESTWLPTRIRIRTRPGHLEVALDGQERRTFASPFGLPIQVPMRHGYAQLTQTLRADGGFQQDFVAVDGTQQNVYVPGPDRTMLLDVTLRSPVLPNEIHFQLTYRRGR